MSSLVPSPSVPANGLTFDDNHVQLRLIRTAPGPDTVSFGLPVRAGAVADPTHISVSANGKAIPARVKVLLKSHLAAAGPRSLEVQFPAATLTGPTLDIDVKWSGGSADSGQMATYQAISVDSPATVKTAERTISNVSGQAKLVIASEGSTTQFTGREPAILVDFPNGYLAGTGILGRQAPAGDVNAAGLAGVKFISEQATPFGLSAMYQESYPLNPDPESVIVPSPDQNFEAWLYDRCATFLSFYVHTGDTRFLREGYRNCSYYASKINLTGENLGVFSGKAEPDAKYSHLRGLYAYFALTGDENALAAGTAIADMWQSDPYFVAAYRAGHIRGPDKVWTERLLAVSMEGLYFGYLLTEKQQYYDSFQALLDTAYRHLTGDAGALAQINPGTPAFPPQNCFIHTAEQHAEGDADEPWCSGWMSELLLPTLLEYQAQTDDKRVDDIFVRLTRFLRDVGSSYFQRDPLDDTFLKPSVAYNPSVDPENPRLLMPLYGAALGLDGKRHNEGEDTDTQHCLDATALTAAGLRGLKRQQVFDKNPIGPFKSEGESFLALENELAFCARQEFTNQTRLHRDPASWTSADLTEGLANPAAFIKEHKIGFPSRNHTPERRLSWWFNSALLDFELLADAGVQIPTIKPGQVQPG